MAHKRASSPDITITIDESQWDEAVKSSSGGCLIADAIMDQHPDLTGATVDMATIRVTDRRTNKRYTYLTPPLAQHLLLAFDQGWRQPTEELRIRRPVKVDPIIRSHVEVMGRAARLADLEVKESMGTATHAEKVSLTRMRNTDSKGGPVAPAAGRAVRKAELEAKVHAGKATTAEKSALTRIINGDASGPRPTSRGPATVAGATRKAVVVTGGSPIPVGAGHPNLLRGRDRHYGAKLADPGIAFREAVEQAVAARLLAAESTSD